MVLREYLEYILLSMSWPNENKLGIHYFNQNFKLQVLKHAGTCTHKKYVRTV